MPVKSPVISPTKDVAVNAPLLELNARLVPDFGPKLPVAAVTNNGKHVVSEDSSATVTVVAIVAVPVVSWLRVGNVQFARFPDAGVPIAGVTNVGLVPKTNAPLPVSFDITPAN